MLSSGRGERRLPPGQGPVHLSSCCRQPVHHLRPSPSLGISGPCFCPDTWFFLLRAVGTKILSLDRTCEGGERQGWEMAQPTSFPLRQCPPTSGVAEPRRLQSPLPHCALSGATDCLGLTLASRAHLWSRLPFFPAGGGSSGLSLPSSGLAAPDPT